MFSRKLACGGASFFDRWIPSNLSYSSWWCRLLVHSLLSSSLLSFCPSISFPMANSQFAAFSSNLTRKTKICSNQYIPRWANAFPVPQPGEDRVVVDKAFGTFRRSKGLQGLVPVCVLLLMLSTCKLEF